MLPDKPIKYLFMIYLVGLLFATFYMIPTITSLYYYAWGEHLAWSYFDGPPMIAYIFSLSNAIFGHTFFSINIVGFVCLMLGAFYIYKTGCLLQDKTTGWISTLIWITLPLTIENVFIRTLYDAPLHLFTILSFYYFSCYLKKERPIDLYLTALFTGGMILSKYTAAVSILGMCVYILFSQHRRLLKKMHFYIATIVLFLIILPMLLWNVEHDWITIKYLVGFHHKSNAHVMKFIMGMLVDYSVFLILSIIGYIKYSRGRATLNEKNFPLEFLYTGLFVAAAFWCIVILFNGDQRAVYLAPLGINIALTAGYTIHQYHYERLFRVVFPIFLLVSIGMIITNAAPVAGYLKKSAVYSVTQEILHHPGFIKEGRPLVTNSYTAAANLSFFIPDKAVYTLPCGESNQYQYWSESFLNDLAKGKIEQISYVAEDSACAEQFFNQCQLIATKSSSKLIPLIHKSTTRVYLSAYLCSSPRKV